jgi:hypothetical protein
VYAFDPSLSIQMDTSLINNATLTIPWEDLRPGLAQIVLIEALDVSKLRRGFDHIEQVIDRWIEKRKVPA